MADSGDKSREMFDRRYGAVTNPFTPLVHSYGMLNDTTAWEISHNGRKSIWLVSFVEEVPGETKPRTRGDLSLKVPCFGRDWKECLKACQDHIENVRRLEALFGKTGQ